jgi:Carboxypeptidase regulatory-like domain
LTAFAPSSVSARSGGVALFVAALVATTPAQAQRVGGTLKDSATKEPLGGAVVTTTDSAGVFLARSISDRAGRFAVFRLRGAAKIHVVRIGYRPYDEFFPLDGVDTMDVRMSPIPSVLAAVSSSSKRVCPGDKGSAAALDLWEQARSGLLAGVVTRETHPPRVRLRSFWRTFDPIRKRLLDDSVAIKDVVVDRSFVAARPAWAFAAEGYMREEVGGDREYFAPDDAVLLDPSFAETHCLRVVSGDAKHAAQVGIGFEPVDDPRRDTLVDVSGVLWMDQAKPALRSFEFHYTNLETYAKNSGGEIHFTAMPNGAPMIDRWTIHSAILATDEDNSLNGVRKRPPPRPMRTNVRLLAFQDVGGEVAFIDWGDGTKWNADLPRFSGVVVDPQGARVTGARVWVRGSIDTTTTGADGTFRLPYMYPGKYVVLASDSTLAPLGIARTVPTPVQMYAPGIWDLWLTFHPRSAVLPLVCPAKSYQPGTGVLMAKVTFADGTPASGALIDVETKQTIVIGDTVTRPRRTIGEAGDDGRFVICGAALDQPMLVRATKGASSASATVETWKDDVISVTLVLGARQP